MATSTGLNKKIVGLLGHLFLFMIVEILFVFLILQELPHFSLFETIGIVHITYFLLVIIAGFVREYTKKFWQRFLCTYIPIVYHVLGHIYIIYQTVSDIQTYQTNETHHYDEHNIVWIIIGTISAGILIFLGEWLLHKKTHCDTYHQSIHKHCKER